VSDRLTDRLISRPARASARKRANADDETRRETSTEGSQPPHTMSEEERARMRRIGSEDARKSRKKQGLPERIEDPAAIAILAVLFRSTRRGTTENAKNHERKPTA
jgi:hypothetical protein